MKADVMVWVQRIVGAVFVIGVLALVGAIVTQVGQAEGIPRCRFSWGCWESCC
ncbi:hypothetical protein ACFSYD_00360 [Paracoccus aerius]